MEKKTLNEDDEILAATVSTYNAMRTPQPQKDSFERVNVLFAKTDLTLIDSHVHELKTMGLRWINRSILVRYALRKLKDAKTDGIAEDTALLELSR